MGLAYGAANNFVVRQMTAAEEHRLERIEAKLEEIHKLLFSAPATKSLPVPGYYNEAEYRLAIRALAKGNPRPLDAYKKKGGVIPIKGAE